MQRIAIIECGTVPQGLQARHGRYPGMFNQALDSAAKGRLRFDALSPVSGDPLGNPADFDGYLLTGSRHGVNDQLEWMAPLQAFIREAARIGKPQVGICFGHQIIASAFGAPIVKAANGWGCGIQTYDFSGPVQETGAFPVPVFHQDQVAAPPENADVIAGNAFCPVGGLLYRSGPVLSYQFHPEFSRTYLQDLINDCRGRIMTDEDARQGHASLANYRNTDRFMTTIADFLAKAKT
ncbi:MAG: type 1 glutamine amidotransferase [Aquisalimonadaceae bacterium]